MSNPEEKYVVPGIPDEFFIRDKVPMTKNEVRVVTMSKLQIHKEDIIWDIGAGTGSMSVEASLMATRGRVYAIEKNPVALTLIEKNKAKFHCENLEAIEGNAPEVLEALPTPNKVIVGGSGGNLLKILQLIDQRLPSDGTVVINAIALDTLSTALIFFKEKSNLWKNHDYQLEIVQISVAKAELVADLTMMKGSNPIYIITARRC